MLGRIRYIERTEYDEYVEANKKRVTENKAYYRLRQSIVEHPFGTIKRSWGYSYTLLKTIPKVEAEFSLIFTAYNMRRAISIFGVKELIERVKESNPALNAQKRLKLKRYKLRKKYLNKREGIYFGNKSMVQAA